MSSASTADNMQANPPDNKNTGETVTVSVRLPGKLARLVRQAAASRNTTRSGFMAEVAIREARAEMKLLREEDFQRYLAKLDQAA